VEVEEAEEEREDEEEDEDEGEEQPKSEANDMRGKSGGRLVLEVPVKNSEALVVSVEFRLRKKGRGRYTPVAEIRRCRRKNAVDQL
jgi:hypothetical protein